MSSGNSAGFLADRSRFREQAIAWANRSRSISRSCFLAWKSHPNALTGDSTTRYDSNRSLFSSAAVHMPRTVLVGSISHPRSASKKTSLVMRPYPSRAHGNELLDLRHRGGAGLPLCKQSLSIRVGWAAREGRDGYGRPAPWASWASTAQSSLGIGVLVEVHPSNPVQLSPADVCTGCGLGWGLAAALGCRAASRASSESEDPSSHSSAAVASKVRHRRKMSVSACLR